jgi:putrescine transport system substrate-binding protein
MFFDNLAIPKDAKNPAEAHALVDYLLRPEIAARNSNMLGYANGNLASQKFIDKSVLEDPTIYPGEGVMKKLFIITAPDQKTVRITSRMWTKIKTGK